MKHNTHNLNCGCDLVFMFYVPWPSCNYIHTSDATAYDVEKYDLLETRINTKKSIIVRLFYNLLELNLAFWFYFKPNDASMCK